MQQSELCFFLAASLHAASAAAARRRSGGAELRRFTAIYAFARCRRTAYRDQRLTRFVSHHAAVLHVGSQRAGTSCVSHCERASSRQAVVRGCAGSVAATAVRSVVIVISYAASACFKAAVMHPASALRILVHKAEQ